MTGVAYETAYANTQTITTTEHSLPNDATFSAGITDPGKFKTKILVPAAAVAADTFRVKGYAEVNGQTITAIWDFVIAGNGTAYVVDCPDIESAEDWDVTIIKLTGTDRAFHWTISEQSQAAASVTQIIGTIVADAAGAVAVSDKTSFALSAAGVTAVQSGLALSTQVDALEGRLPGTLLGDAAGHIIVGSFTVAAGGVLADYVWDEAVDGSTTGRQSFRINNAAAAGKLSGAATTNIKIRDLADSKDRIDATVDSDGNRTAVTVDAT